jgi:hypothetical protein
MDAPPDDYDDDKPCFVCLDAAPEAVLLECGHGGLCVACAERLWQRERRCPLCRAGFAGVMRIVGAEAGVVRKARPGAHEQTVATINERGMLGEGMKRRVSKV